MEQQQAVPPPKLPVGLAGVLNSPEENRDSAYFSSTDGSSKHNSAASCLGISVLSPPPSGPSFHSSPSDKTPSPTTASAVVPSFHSPTASNMSVASMVSPTSTTSADPPRFDRPQSLETAPTTAIQSPTAEQEAAPRRESVDSRINQGFGDMRLGSSPYASHNQSSTSIHSTLAQQRNPRAGLDTLAVHRISNGYQPSAERNPEGHVKIIRTAPAITGPATSNIARAAEPTKGQAWAFPEEEIQRLPSAHGQPAEQSRRSSLAESLASSQFTSESRLPPGQRRLDDGLPSADYARLSSTSADFPSVHHHSLQHKHLGDLQNEELGPHGGSQPYSRTPELRISHKLAERKRRTEMKELFEQLRDLMPQERGSKASKWEILTKAITEYQRQTETIKYLQNHCNAVQSENDQVRREVQQLRMENNQMRAELSNVPPQASRVPAQTLADPFMADQYGRPAAPRPELPPLRALSGSVNNAAHGPDSMTGVQFEQPRVNGFRGPPERF